MPLQKDPQQSTSPQRDSSHRSSHDRGSGGHRSSGHPHTASRNSSSHRSSSYHPSKPKGDNCWVCGKRALPGKLACGQCRLEATVERQDSPNSIKDLIKESIRELSSTQAIPSPPSTDQEVAGPSTPYHGESISEDEPVPNEEDISTFDFSLVEPFVVAVKDANQWEEDCPEPPSQNKEVFSSFDKKSF
ncbi:uncharacterized protein LOC120911444 isoform X2 [Rana temporaria]|uniref:uncharacterized protein LOC120911444 isoform X2 n=1 Tax=Rana temporaria TaxID=8407 RepID=UPI001AADDC89|nr:uncharacterized protein LOC120911444 isoform X2 [Rana temporaria]